MLPKLLVCLLSAAALFAAEKQYKPGEYDLYKAAADDLGASNFAKALADLDAWKQKFPDSDYADDRQLLYVHAYAGANQPGKVIDAAGELLNKDVDAVLGNPGNVVSLLFKTVVAVQQVPEPTPAELSAAGKAARLLLTYDKKPEKVSAEAWAQARAQAQTAARGALVYMAIQPGMTAIKKNDCAAAESSLTNALRDYPDSAQAAWYMAVAQLCLAKTQPDKASPAIYELARAAVADPVKGLVDPKWQRETVDPYLEKAYTRYHGQDPEGLKQLKELALASALPPADFHLKSVSEIAHDKELAFEKSNPQLALWMKIKAALSESNGEQYFESSLKDANVPQLKGALVSARPACRPRELTVAVGQEAPAEITLKLDKPLAGKPQPHAEFQWRGVPTAFTASPFMLTMETETAKIEGLKVTPCSSSQVVRKKR